MSEAPSSRPDLGGIGLALIAVFGMSIVPLMIKIGLAANVDPVSIVTMRLVIAITLLWPLFALFRPDVLRIDRRGLLACLLVAASNSTSALSFNIALARLDGSIAQVLYTLYPLIVLGLLALRGEPLRWWNLVSVAFALTGIYLLLGFSGKLDLFGLLPMCLTVFFFALHLVLIQWLLGDYPFQTVTLYVLSLMTAIMGTIYLIQGHGLPHFSPSGWGAVLALGIFSTAVARLTMFGSVQRIGSGRMALIDQLETPLAVLWVVIFLGERLTPIQWFGGLLVVIGATLAAWRKGN